MINLKKVILGSFEAVNLGNAWLIASAVEVGKMAKMARKQIDVAIAVIVRDKRVLITQRKATDSFPGYWEFPGGKREPCETLDQTLRRELIEELAIHVEPIHTFQPLHHRYRSTIVILHPFLCRLTAGQPQMIECQAMQWINPTDLRTQMFPPANETLIEAIIAHLTDTTEEELPTTN